MVWGILTIAAGLGMYFYFYRICSRHRQMKEKNSPVVRTLFPDRGETGSKRLGNK